MGDLFSPLHILIIVLIVLLLFGPSKLPGLARAAGQAIKEFRSASEKDTGREATSTALDSGTSDAPQTTASKSANTTEHADIL